MCTKTQYRNIKTAPLAQYIVHYVDQLLAKSNMNQSTAQSSKVEKLNEITQPTSVPTE